MNHRTFSLLMFISDKNNSRFLNRDGVSTRPLLVHLSEHFQMLDRAVLHVSFYHFCPFLHQLLIVFDNLSDTFRQVMIAYFHESLTIVWGKLRQQCKIRQTLILLSD